MNRVYGHLYRALLAANVPDDLAEQAAQLSASAQAPIDRVREHIIQLRWLSLLTLGGIVLLLLKG
jgi:hypothetical protein